MTLNGNRPIYLKVSGARGEGILDVVRRKHLNGTASNASDDVALENYTEYMADLIGEGIVVDAVAAKDAAEVARDGAVAAAASTRNYNYETVDQAAALVIPAPLAFIITGGMSELGDSQELLQWNRWSGSGSAPDHPIYFTDADGAIFEYVPGPNGINFVAAGGDEAAADNRDAWNAAKTYVLQSPNQVGRLNFPAGGAYDFADTITWDCSIMSVQLNGCYLNFTTPGAGKNGIKVDGSNPNDGSPYYNNRFYLEGGFIFGPNSGSNAGLYEVPAGPGTAHVEIRNCSIAGWARGVEVGSNAYLISHSHCGIFFNTNNVVDTFGASNSGENMSFYKCSIFGAVNSGIYLLFGSGSFRFTDTSVDHNGITGGQPQIYIRDSSVTFTTCHLEVFAEQILFAETFGNKFTVDFFGCRFVAPNAMGSTPLIKIGNDAVVNFFGGQFTTAGATNVTTIKVLNGGSVGIYTVQEDHVAGAFLTVDSGGYQHVIATRNSACQLGASAAADAIITTAVSTSKIAAATSVVLSATATPVTVGPVGAYYFFYDVTRDEQAEFACGLGSTPQSRHNDILGFSCTRSGTDVQVTVSSSAPRTIKFARISFL